MTIDLVLDSGAYTSWAQKQEIDLDAYIAYIKGNCEFFDHYVNLDVIPGEWGRVPSPEEVEGSAQRGWDNMLYMQEHGLDPVPVFHMGEGFHWLERMIDHGCTYIGISPANDRTTAQKREWLDEVFSLITDDQGWPIIKTHGFGVTAVPLLYRYPWYSADSTSWMLFAAYGMVLVPQRGPRGFRYDVSPYALFVTEQSKKPGIEGKHFDMFGDMTRKHIQEYLESCGVTMAQLKESYLYRAQVNARYFRDVAEKMPRHPLRLRKGGFLHEHKEKMTSPYGITFEDEIRAGLKLIFATNGSAEQSDVLNKAGVKHRLLSYFYIKKNPENFLPEYTSTGIFNRVNRKARNERKQLVA